MAVVGLVFKIWDVHRQKKVFVKVDDYNDQKLYINLILEASKKLDINGSSLALESDGTIIDEDDVLRHLNKETMILLAKEEHWRAVGDTNLSTCSTETFRGDISDITCESETPSGASSPPDTFLPSENVKISENSWKTFAIPWEVFSRSVIKDCEKGNRNYNSINTVVHTVVDRIRDVKVHVPTKVFKIIANKIIDKYPIMFQDIDEDDVVLGDGAQSITQKMIERNNYLNRSHKRKSFDQTLDIGPKYKRKMLACKAGCSNWQPDSSNLEPDHLNEYKNCLKSYSSESLISLHDSKLRTMLEETYAHQRLFINKLDSQGLPPSIQEIIQEWPILFKRCGMYWHYEKLMGHSIHNFMEVLRTKVPKILKFGTDKRYIQAQPITETDKNIACLTIIGRFFNENVEREMIISIKQNEEPSEKVMMINHNAPCIIRKTCLDEDEFSIFTEKYLIDKVYQFEEALKIFWALYYNLNLSYPPNLSMTLEFIQRYILKINPDQGSKGKKKSTGLVKLCSLMNKLKNVNV